jgi:hypothetical protein
VQSASTVTIAAAVLSSGATTALRTAVVVLAVVAATAFTRLVLVQSVVASLVLQATATALLCRVQPPLRVPRLRRRRARLHELLLIAASPHASPVSAPCERVEPPWVHTPQLNQLSV